MGWLGDLLKKIAGDPSMEMIFVPSIQAPGIPGFGDAIKADSCYIELYLESLRLNKARRFATKFNGVVYSFMTLPREGDEHAHLAAVSKPAKLAELDPNSINHVLTISKQIMGPTAFRGGTVSLEFGLFSIKTGNLLTPVLDYIAKVSSTAGISYVGAIKPLLPLITEGMDLIAGQQQDTKLEVGIDTDLTLTTGCVAAIIAKPKGSIDPSSLSLDKDQVLLSDGKPLYCGYAVFSLRPTLEKSDYGEIPELKEKYAAIQSAIKGGKNKDAQDALTAFRLATIASPDLIPSDASKLVDKAKKKVDDAFPPERIAASRTSVRVETLSEIGLY